MSKQLNFKIKDKDTHQTRLGGILSIFIFLQVIFLFIFFGQNYFTKTNPSGFSQIIPSSHSVIKPLNLTAYPFLVGFQIYDDDFIRAPIEEYFHLIFTLRKTELINGKKITTRKQLNSITCDKVPIGGHINLAYHNLSTFVCPDISKENITIYGNFDDDLSYSIEFFISLCDFDNSNCKKNITKIQEFDKGKRKWVSTISPQVSYDIDNYKTPLSAILHNSYQLFNTYKYLYEEYIISRYESVTDFGDFFPKIRKDDSIGVSKIFATSLLNMIDKMKFEKTKDFTENILYKGYILMNKEKFFYSRWYMKIPDIFAMIFSIVNGMILIFSFLYTFYYRYHFGAYLCRHYLFYEDETNEEKRQLRNYFKFNNELSRNEIMKKLNIDKSKNSYNNKKNEKDIKINEKELKNNINGNDQYLQSDSNLKNIDKTIRLNFEDRIKKYQKKNILKVNYFKYIKNKIFNSNSKSNKIYNIIDIVYQKFEKNIDVFYFIKEMNKIEIYEKIIFSDNNYNMFDLVKSKLFRINNQNLNEITFENSDEMKLKMNLEYLLNANNLELKKNDEIIINYFLGKF